MLVSLFSLLYQLPGLIAVVTLLPLLPLLPAQLGGRLPIQSRTLALVYVAVAVLWATPCSIVLLLRLIELRIVPAQPLFALGVRSGPLLLPWPILAVPVLAIVVVTALASARMHRSLGLRFGVGLLIALLAGLVVAGYVAIGMGIYRS